MEFILLHALYFVMCYQPSQTVFREWSQIFRFITSQLSERPQIMYMSLLEFRMQTFRTMGGLQTLAKALTWQKCIHEQSSSHGFKAQWLPCVPPHLTFNIVAFYYPTVHFFLMILQINDSCLQNIKQLIFIIVMYCVFCEM